MTSPYIDEFSALLGVALGLGWAGVIGGIVGHAGWYIHIGVAVGMVLYTGFVHAPDSSEALQASDRSEKIDDSADLHELERGED